MTERLSSNGFRETNAFSNVLQTPADTVPDQSLHWHIIGELQLISMAARSQLFSDHIDHCTTGVFPSVFRTVVLFSLRCETGTALHVPD